MSASYPGSIKTFTTRNNGDTIQPSHVNDLQDEVNAIETEILSGGVTLTSGRIAFPATQVASANANTLDDYAEGTHAAALTFGGASVGITYAINSIRYVKIGRQVSLAGRVSLTSKGTSTGAAAISLPFTAENQVAGVGGTLPVGIWSGMNTAITFMSLAVGNNATFALLWGTGVASTASGALNDANFTNTSDLTFGGVYLASS